MEEKLISFRTAERKDIANICELYQRVAITPSNMEERTTPGKNSFSHRGGMFHPLCKDEVEEILKSKEDKVCIGEYDGEAGGFVWYGEIEKPVFASLKPFPGREKEAAYLTGPDAEKMFGYAKDIVTSHVPTSGILCKFLHAKAMDEFIKAGKQYAVFELYRVIAVIDENNNKRECDLFNEASGNIMKTCGCFAIGETKEKELKIGKNICIIRPTIFIADAKESYDLAIKAARTEM